MHATTRLFTRLVAPAALVFGLLGCGQQPRTTNSPVTAPNVAGETPPADEEAAAVAAERAKLSPEDRALVESQEWCAISNDERLGSMGPPLKLDIKGQPVFVCCKGCKKNAEANPDKTLATVAELKAKAKAERAAPKAP